MVQFGLIGKSISHSYSPKIFKEKFETLKIEATYNLFPLEKIDDILLLIDSKPELLGLNITIPYKTAILPFLDFMEESVEKLEACNTILIKNRQLIGYNTDIIGFEKTIEKFNLNPQKTAIILGDGGAAQSVKHVLTTKGIQFFTISRNKIQNKTYQDLTENIINTAQLIINTTPVGMYPEIKMAPRIPYEFINKSHIAIDLIYNPVETIFLKNCKQNGAKTANGLTMLNEQAEASWKIWEKHIIK